jgi:hypothetical protein
MRFAPSLLLTIAVATSAFGGAVAGTTRVLVDGPQNAFWAPLAGGAVEPLAFEPSLPSFGSQKETSVATDGERFLVAYCGSGIGIYGEGELHAQRTALLTGRNARCFARWDAARERYLVAYHDDERARIAAVSRHGEILQTASVPGIDRVSGLAVNGDRVLVLEAPGWPANDFLNDHVSRVHAQLLRADFTPVKDITLGTIRDPQPYQEVFSAVPFGTGFYVAWYQGILGWGGVRDSDSTVLGTRITADGDAPDVQERTTARFGTETVGRILLRRAENVIGADLIQRGDHLIAVMKRAEKKEQLVPLEGVFVAEDGLTLGTRNFAQVRLNEFDRFTRLDTARLSDGTHVAVSMVDLVATIHPINTSLPSLPRRRAVR